MVVVVVVVDVWEAVTRVVVVPLVVEVVVTGAAPPVTGVPEAVIADVVCTIETAPL